MNKADNVEGGRDEKDQSDRSQPSRENAEDLPGGYYYDDSTGYEIFKDDEVEEEPSQPRQ
jgi:hypothetical protein